MILAHLLQEAKAPASLLSRAIFALSMCTPATKPSCSSAPEWCSWSAGLTTGGGEGERLGAGGVGSGGWAGSP